MKRRSLISVKISRFISVVIAIACMFCQNSHGYSLVVPNYAVSSQLANSADGMFANIAREQTIYGASEFPPYPIVITQIQWRPDIFVGRAITNVAISNIQINLSTTKRSPDQLSLNFDQNTGSDETAVFGGYIVLGTFFTVLTNGTTGFDISVPLQTPFVYDSSKGNLLVDVRNFSGGTANLYDNSMSSSSDAVSRIFSSDANAINASAYDTGGGAMQLTYNATPPPLIIVDQPSSQTISINMDATFTVLATGVNPLSYQWFYNDLGHPIGGATNSSLTLNSVDAGQAGSYFVEVADTFGMVVSSNAFLTVRLLPPEIILEPVSQIVTAGSPATFVVGIQNSLSAGYQWFFNITNLISGATNASLTLTNIQIDQVGFYSVRITNSSGVANSSDAKLSIGLVLPNNAASNQINNNAEGLFVAKLREQVVYGASEFPSYPIMITELRWRPDSIAGGALTNSISNIQVNLSTTVNAADHLNSIFSQNIGTDDTMVFQGGMTAVTSFTALSNGTKAFDIVLPLQNPFLYDSSKGNLLVDVHNFSGGNANLFNNSSGAIPDSVSRIFNANNVNAASATGIDTGGGSLQIVYEAASRLPIIMQQPTSQIVAAGSTVLCSVTAKALSPLEYQWFFNDINHPIDGATNSSVTFSNMQSAQEGNYFVEVANAFGRVFSSNALIAIVVNPLVVLQPLSQVVAIGNTAVFSINVQSAVPVTYQWFFNATNAIPGEVGASLVLTNVQPYMEGFYSVRVANVYGFAISSNANLITGVTLPNYAESYQVDNNAESIFVNMEREQAVYGSSQFPPYPIIIKELRWRPDSIVDNPITNLISNLQINLSTTTSNADRLNAVFAKNIGPDNTMVFDGGAILSTDSLTLTNGNKAFDISIPLQTSFLFDSSRGNLLVDIHNFSGGISGFYNNTVSTGTDTVSRIYNSNNPNASSASGSDTGAGALQLIYNPAPVPPTISAQPTNRVVVVGGTTTFSVLAGPPLLSYQWFFNTNTPLPGETNASLVLTNVQMAQAGMYSVMVSNVYGVTASTNASLTVSFPPAVIQVGSTNVMGGTSFDVPVFLVANGNENTLNFSLNFNTQRLAYAGIALGNGAEDASLLPNASQAANGKLGVNILLPSGETFAAGTQEVARVTFLSAIQTGSQSVVTPINFTNQPINKLLFDAQGNKLATNFINGSITLSPTDYEGDVAPRTNGDRSLDVFDWAQVGRFVAGLDVVSNATEFQRADCAPKATSGDGQLKVTDWVQAGRYGAAIESATAVGGPTSPVAPTILTGGPRTLTVGSGSAVNGLNLAVPIILQSQGNENAVGFSVNFNPAVLKYLGTTKGSATTSATLNVNSNQVASGILGVAVALPAGNNFASGSQEVAKVNFKTLVSTTNTSVAFSDAPVIRAVSDPLANELSASYSNSSLVVNSSPTLSIATADTNALLSWPIWATGFNLQSAGTLIAPTWTNVPGNTQTNGSNISIAVPMFYQGGYFRLLHP